ncbi:MAG: DUF1669 domain-containing protein [bacterium]|nr:DUF1669 domain-containing protein [bacterium]
MMRVILILLLFISGCSITGNVVFEEPEFNYTIYFCPQDNCIDVFYNVINNAKSTHCALYNADDSIINLLESKELVMNKDRSGYGLMHNKFCIIDGEKVITGSFNPTKFSRNHKDNIIIIESKALAQIYEAEFQELSNNIFGSGEKNNKKLRLDNTLIEIYFCPEDNCIYNLRKHLLSANKSIYFMTYSFTHPSVANDLIIKHNQGIEIRGVLEKTSYSKYPLLSNHTNVILHQNKQIMHNKVFIIDNKTVITGSFNPTKSADTKNDENMLVIHNKEVAMRYIKEILEEG